MIPVHCFSVRLQVVLTATGCSMQVAAEKRAMQLAAELDVKLIAICPNFNLGPPLSDRVDGTSVLHLKVRHRLVNCLSVTHSASTPAQPGCL